MNRTKPAVNGAINQLVEAGVLIPLSTNRRNRAWEAAGLLELIARLESGDLSEEVHGPFADQERCRPAVASRRPPFSVVTVFGAPGAQLVAHPTDRHPRVTAPCLVAIPTAIPGLSGNPFERAQRCSEARNGRSACDLLANSPITEHLRDSSTMFGTRRLTPSGKQQEPELPSSPALVRPLRH